MDASRPTHAVKRRPRRGCWRARCIVACSWPLLAAVAVADVGDAPGIRLPAWQEPAQTSERAAPRPQEEDDLGRLLLAPAAAAEPRRLPVPVADDLPEREAPTLRQLEHAATDADTPRELGRLIARCREARGAIAEGGQRRRVDRVSAWAHAIRARLRSESGDERAGYDFVVALRLDPTDTATRHEFALWLASRGEIDRAIDHLSRVIQSSPADRAALRNRATLLVRVVRATEAAADATRWVALVRRLGAGHEDELADAFAVRGAAWQKAGRLEAAVGDLNRSLRLRPGDAWTTLARANVQAERGYYREAITDYAVAASDPATAADAYRALAWVLATCPDTRLRDPTNATEAARRARRLAGDTPLVLDASAAAMAASGRYEQAAQLQQRVVLAAADQRPAGAEVRLALYEEGHPYVATTAQ